MLAERHKVKFLDQLALLSGSAFPLQRSTQESGLSKSTSIAIRVIRLSSLSRPHGSREFPNFVNRSKSEAMFHQWLTYGQRIATIHSRDVKDSQIRK